MVQLRAFRRWNEETALKVKIPKSVYMARRVRVEWWLAVYYMYQRLCAPIWFRVWYTPTVRLLSNEHFVSPKIKKFNQTHTKTPNGQSSNLAVSECMQIVNRHTMCERKYRVCHIHVCAWCLSSIEFAGWSLLVVRCAYIVVVGSRSNLHIWETFISS